MSEEIKLEGMKIAPGVLDTIVTMAVKNVDGVVYSSSGQGFGGLVNRASGKAVEFCVNDQGEVAVCVHLAAVYGTPLRDIGKKVQSEVTDAIRSQVGVKVASVDVFIDDIEFPA